MNKFMQSGTGLALRVSNGVHGFLFDSIIESLMPSVIDNMFYRGCKISAQYVLGAVTVIPMLGLLLSVVWVPLMIMILADTEDGFGLSSEQVDKMNTWGEFNHKTDYNDQAWYK